MKTKLLTASLALAGLLAGCVTTAPAQLLEARSAYTKSNAGLAGKLAPIEVYDAQEVIDTANLEFDTNGDTLQCRDYAYIAHRKLQLADAKDVSTMSESSDTDRTSART